MIAIKSLSFLSTPFEECERRDVKGFYKLAKEGGIKSFTGRDSVYETPDNAEITLDTTIFLLDEAVEQILEYLIKFGYFIKI